MSSERPIRDLDIQRPRTAKLRRENQQGRRGHEQCLLLLACD